ncbi:hypothetical protein C8R47DRAFT_1108917 [Mycena vitilis]|nr:hypothetical protein C8R47DRAFT_1108917 [Mycena vitilis]
MDATLCVSACDKLPHSIKAACRETRTTQNVEHARDQLQGSERQAIAFLPAFFINLDPTLIPTWQQLLAFEPTTRDAVTQAVISLDAISFIYMRTEPPEPGVPLWLRIWAWTQFLETRWDKLPGVPLPPHPIFYLDFMTIAGRFHDGISSWSFVSKTPGFWTMIARAWTSVSLIPERQREYFLGDLGSFLADSDPGDSTVFSELVEGAGGTLGNLAVLVVAYIRSVAGRTNPVCAGSREVDLYRLNLFLVREQCQGHIALEKSEPLTPFSAILIEKDVIGELVRTMLVLTFNPVDATGAALEASFQLLGRLLLSAPGAGPLGRALHCGILRVIIRCATLRCKAEVYHNLHFFLATLFPPRLVFLENVLMLKSAMEEVASVVAEDAFVASTLSGEWATFVTVAESRIAIASGFRSRESLRACDNLQCAVLDVKTRFRRCSGCSSFYYCSRECQKADWQDGGHRSGCANCDFLFLNANHFALVRERDFVRQLMNHDYAVNFPAIQLAQLKAMRANLASTLFVTVFDYSHIPPRIMVFPCTELFTKRETEWEYMAGRAGRSGGRMHLHLIKVEVGPVARSWLVPLRSSSSAFYESMVALARTTGINVPDDALSTAIGTLTQDAGELVVSH